VHTLITVVIERGQTFIPAKIRPQFNLKSGQKLRWQKVGDNELRINSRRFALKNCVLHPCIKRRNFHT
jgi:AbrB family looped-hinge helix DNA binding protein